MFGQVVLVVAQDDGLGNLVRQLIRGELGVHTVLARDREIALERIRKGKPSAVVLDVMPTEPWGIEVIRELKSDLVTKDIPVIALAPPGAGSEEAREAGCDVCSPKPLDFDGFLGKVATCLSNPSDRVMA